MAASARKEMELKIPMKRKINPEKKLPLPAIFQLARDKLLIFCCMDEEWR